MNEPEAHSREAPIRGDTLLLDFCSKYSRNGNRENFKTQPIFNFVHDCTLSLADRTQNSTQPRSALAFSDAQCSRCHQKPNEIAIRKMPKDQSCTNTAAAQNLRTSADTLTHAFDLPPAEGVASLPKRARKTFVAMAYARACA